MPQSRDKKDFADHHTTVDRGIAPGRAAAAQAWARITVPYLAQRPLMRRSPDGGRSFPRSSSKGYRYEVAIKPVLPTRPATVPTCDVNTGRSRLLVLDLDVSQVPPVGAADRAGYIAAVADRITALVAECGGRVLVDVSPSGGRHCYLLWSEERLHRELRELAHAFARRFAVVDTSPMNSSDGQIRGPGAPHRSEGGRLTGYMTLTCSIETAEEICAHPNGPQVWELLHLELAAELDAVAGGAVEARRPDCPADLDDRGEPWLHRLGGRGRLRADLEETARTGAFDRGRYLSSSEARQAVLTSAAARGWRLEQVRAQLSPTGPWAAIGSWWRDDALLAAEWAKAVAIAYRSPAEPLDPPAAQEVGDPIHSCNTSGRDTTPPAPRPTLSHPPSSAPCSVEVDSTRLPYVVKEAGCFWPMDVRVTPAQHTPYQQVRTWQQAMRITERLLELEWGERALTYRAVLRAVGAAAQMSGSTTIEFGTRQLAVMTGLDHTTISRALRTLSTGPYALLDLVREARGTRADTYHLVVPDAVAAEAQWRRWRPGRIDAIHPAFRRLGLPAAFAYEALSSATLTASELSSAALLPRSTTYAALAVLAAYRLAEKGPDGAWRRGPADLNVVAAATGADKLMAAHIAEHRRDRADWHAWLRAVGLLTDLDELEPYETQPEAMALVTIGAAAHGAGPRPAVNRRVSAVSTRSAPPWLLPPPRRRPIGEGDIGWSAECLAALREMPDPAMHSDAVHGDVSEAARADWAAIVADEQHLAAERAEYEAELAELRAAAQVPGGPPPVVVPAPREEIATPDDEAALRLLVDELGAVVLPDPAGGP